MLESAVGIIFSEDSNAVLLVKRKDLPVWVLPGGGIDEGEQPLDAAIREVKEETGLDVEVVREVAQYTPVNRLSRNTYLFECRVTGGAITCSDETVAVGYYHEDEVPGYLFDLHRQWITDTRQRLPQVIRAPLSGTSYWKVASFFLRHPGLTLRYIASVKFWKSFLQTFFKKR